MKALVLLLFVSFSTCIYAKVKEPSSDQDELFNLSLEQLLDLEVTVASYSVEKKLYAAANVTIFSQKQLQSLGVRFLKDLYQHIPGFYSGYNSFLGNQSVLMTRGHAQKYANTVLFLYNGMRINDDYTGGISYFLRYFDISTASRIEIIRGPGSAIYGSNAFHGVINIITDTKDHLFLSTGDPLDTRVSAGYNYPINSEWKAGFNFSAYRDRGITLKPIFDRFERQTTTKDPNQAMQFEVAIENDNFSWHSMYQESEREKSFLFRRVFDEHNNLQLSNGVHKLKYRNSFADNIDADFTAQYRHSHRKSLGGLSPQDEANFPDDDFLFGVHIQYTSFEVGANLNYQLTQNTSINGGLNYARSKVPSSFLKSNYHIFDELQYLGRVTLFDEPENRTVKNTLREIYSVYTQLNSNITDRLKFTIGGRYDDYNDVEGRFTPRIAGIFKVTPKDIFKVLYNEAYRAPSLGDLYDDESGLTSGNDMLNSTSLKSIELVYNRITLAGYHSFTLFKNEIKNLIGFTGGNTVRLDNVARNTSTGFEYEGRFSLTSNMSIMANYSHLFKNKTENQQLSEIIPSELLVPDRNGSITLNTNLDTKWTTNIQLNWRDNIDILQSQQSLTTVNLLVDYKYSEHSRINLNVINVFDQSYSYPIAVPLGQREDLLYQQIPGRSRQIELGWTYFF